MSAPAEIVFSLKSWSGDYESHDIPGGVQITPHRTTIHAVRWDGTLLRTVIDDGARAEAPQWSPDGGWVYFQINRDGRWSIRRCRPDGTMDQDLSSVLPFGRECFGAVLSADGRKLVCTAHDGKVGKVLVMNSDGTDAAVIAPELGYCYMVSFSPDGNTVVFAQASNGYRLVSYDLTRDRAHHLAPDHPESFVPRFTPDGRHIVFIRRDGDIYRIDADGQNLVQLTRGNGYLELHLGPHDHHGSTDGPSLSPDGRHIAYVGRVENSAQVHVMRIDGGGQRALTRLPGNCGRVKWSRDGFRIAFVSFVDALPQLFEVGAEGGECRKITALPGAVYALDT